jgi:hypothetical protein
MAPNAVTADIRSVHPNHPSMESWITATAASSMSAWVNWRCVKAYLRPNSRKSANGITPASAQVIAVNSGWAPVAKKPKAVTISTMVVAAASRALCASELPACSAGVPIGRCRWIE